MIRIGLVCVVGAMVIVLSGCCNCEEFGEMKDLVGTGMEVFQQAQSAPGTTELKSAGCENAMVFTPEMFAKFEESMNSMDSANTKNDFPKESQIVMCSLPATISKPPACDLLARVYIEAAKPTLGFHLTVNKTTDDKPICKKNYQPDFK